MSNFICMKIKLKKGVGWADEERIYKYYPKFLHMFLRLRHMVVMSERNIGEFYFPPDKKAFPEDASAATKLKPFAGKGIFDWLEKNVTKPVRVHCRRNWVYSNLGDFDKFEIAVFFASEEDAMFFKMVWN